MLLIRHNIFVQFNNLHVVNCHERSHRTVFSYIRGTYFTYPIKLSTRGSRG